MLRRFSCTALALGLMSCGSQQVPTATRSDGIWRTASHATSPSSVPVQGTYSLYGCQVYGTRGHPDPIVNAVIRKIPADPASPSLIALIEKERISGVNDAKLEVPNLASNSTPKVVVRYGDGHRPPITKGPYGGGGGAKYRWIGGTFQIENSNISRGHDAFGGGDAHSIILNTDNCYVYESGGTHWSSQHGYSAYDGIKDYLGVPYAAEYRNKLDNVQVSGIPLVGFALFGPDFLLKHIYHPVSLMLPTTHVVAYGSSIQGVNYATGVGADGLCHPNDDKDPTNCFVYGDIFGLNPNYKCPLDDRITAAVCEEFKNSGLVLADTGKIGNIRTGLDANGKDDSDATLWAWLKDKLPKHPLTFSNFRVIKRGSITVKGKRF